MTFYLHPYPFSFAQSGPYRRPARRRIENVHQSLEVNIREEDEAFILSALVPGLKSDDLNIQVLGDVVRIEGEFQQDENRYLLQELPRGSFTRTLRLPVPIDANRVEAKIADGILTLTLPKADSARPKKIRVTSR